MNVDMHTTNNYYNYHKPIYRKKVEAPQPPKPLDLLQEIQLIAASIQKRLQLIDYYAEQDSHVN